MVGSSAAELKGVRSGNPELREREVNKLDNSLEDDVDLGMSHLAGLIESSSQDVVLLSEIRKLVLTILAELGLSNLYKPNEGSNEVERTDSGPKPEQPAISKEWAELPAPRVGGSDNQQTGAGASSQYQGRA